MDRHSNIRERGETSFDYSMPSIRERRQRSCAANRNVKPHRTDGMEIAK